MELAVAGDGRVFYVEKGGRLGLYDPAAGATREVGNLPVVTQGEHGLIGLALDPGFAANGWIYLTYSRPRLPASISGCRASPLRATRSTRARRSPCCRSRPTVAAATRRGRSHSARGRSVRLDRRRHVPVRVERLHADRRAPGALGLGCTEVREQHERPARQDPSHPADCRRRLHDPGGQPLPRRQWRKARDLRHGAAQSVPLLGRRPHRFALRRRVGARRAAPEAPSAGPRGYDEINRTSTAGNFGWPYCIADNEPYVDYDFATGLSGQPFPALRRPTTRPTTPAPARCRLQAGPALVPVRQVAPSSRSSARARAPR